LTRKVYSTNEERKTTNREQFNPYRKINGNGQEAKA